MVYNFIGVTVKKILNRKIIDYCSFHVSIVKLISFFIVL